MFGGNMKQYYNLEAERAVLGACILDVETLTQTCEILKADDFYLTAHQVIYQAMLELFKNNIPVDLITLSNYLRDNKQLDVVGGYVALTNLTSTIPVIQNISQYHKIIAEKSKQRKIYTILGNLKDGKIDIDTTLNEISKLPEVIEQEETLDIIFQNAILNSTKGTTHKFKLPSLNHYLGGIDKGELITIGGYTSTGKTSLALSLAIDFAEMGKRVLYLTSEMSVYEVARRILANQLPKNVMTLRKGIFSPGEIKALEDIAKNASEKWQLYIKKVYDIEGINTYIRKYTPEIVFVDYLQNLDRRGARSDYEKVTGNIKDIQGITLRNEITSFVLSQLSRNKEQIREPRLNDLRDSGRIEEVSNIVLFVYWENRLKDKVTIRMGGEPPEILNVKISKNRDGCVGEAPLAFWPEYCRIGEFEKGENIEKNNL